MADNYLTSDDYEALLGADVVAAVVEVVGTAGLDALAEQATSFLQGFMQNSGYATPTLAEMVATNTPALGVIRLATGAALRELVSSLPDISQPVPDNWAQNVGKRSMEGVLSGDMQLVGLTQNVGTSPGGWLMTTTTASSNGVLFEQRASRRNLSGY
jgi:hypothetical protein